MTAGPKKSSPGVNSVRVPTVTIRDLRLAEVGFVGRFYTQWPLFDEITSPETIARLLEHLAEEAPTQDETQNMRRAAHYVRSLGGDAFRRFVVGAVAAVIRAQVGLD